MLYTLANKIGQRSESSLETLVPYHSNCNAMQCIRYAGFIMRYKLNQLRK